MPFSYLPTLFEITVNVNIFQDKIKHTGYMNDGRLIDIVSSEEEDDEKFVALRYIGD